MDVHKESITIAVLHGADAGRQGRLFRPGRHEPHGHKR
jgi:hypothetical protein